MRFPSFRLFICAALVAAVIFSGCSTPTSSSADTSTDGTSTGSTSGDTGGTTTTASSAKAITAFSFASLSVSGTIDETAHTIAVTVPYGTAVTALTPTITTSGSSVSPASGAAQDFTNPVTYTVTAADGSTQAYVVTVKVAAASDIVLLSAPSITIDRSGSSDSAFVFTVSAVTGAATYKAYIGGVEVASSTTTTLSVPKTAGLSETALTEITVKALNSSGIVISETATCAGMTKYSDSTKINETTNINKLKALYYGLEALQISGSSAFSEAAGNLFNDVSAHAKLCDDNATTLDAAIYTYAFTLKNADNSDKYADDDAVAADWENIVASYFNTQIAPTYNKTWTTTYADGFAILSTNITAIRTYYTANTTNSAAFESALLLAWFNGTDTSLNAIKAADLKAKYSSITTVN